MKKIYLTELVSKEIMVYLSDKKQFESKQCVLEETEMYQGKTLKLVWNGAKFYAKISSFFESKNYNSSTRQHWQINGISEISNKAS